MNEQKIMIIESELADAICRLNYHRQKKENAEVLVNLFHDKLEEAKAEFKS